MVWPQVRLSGDTMTELVESVSRVAQIIGEITHAMHEQSDRISQITASVGLLDPARENAALVEQSARFGQPATAGGEAEQSVAVFRVLGCQVSGPRRCGIRNSSALGVAMVCTP